MHGQNIRLVLTYPSLAYEHMVHAIPIPANIISPPTPTSIMNIDLLNTTISTIPSTIKTSPTPNIIGHVIAQHGIGMMS